MKIRLLHEVEADTCAPCQAVWLDPGEIQRIIRRQAPPPGRTAMVGDGYSAGDIALDVLLNSDVLIDLGSLILRGLKETPELAASAGGAVLEFVGDIFDGLS
jgi:Zn-finger nucleic acid-binding protein